MVLDAITYDMKIGCIAVRNAACAHIRALLGAKINILLLACLGMRRG
jgi:hypothetical protein